MTQLIASVALMYLVVGTVGYWSVRKQRQLKAESIDEPTPQGAHHG